MENILMAKNYTVEDVKEIKEYLKRKGIEKDDNFLIEKYKYYIKSKENTGQKFCMSFKEFYKSLY